MIKVQIEAYGAVTQFLPSALMIDMKTKQSLQVEQVLDEVIRQYPQAEKAIQKCACAIGDEMIARQALLERDCTLVLLSPVAGG